MQKISLDALADHHLRLARDSSAGRSASTVYGGHERSLRQTVIAMREGTEMSEHPNPGQSTLQVLPGRVRRFSGAHSWDARTGDMIIIPEARHSLTALADSAILLTVVMNDDPPEETSLRREQEQQATASS